MGHRKSQDMKVRVLSTESPNRSSLCSIIFKVSSLSLSLTEIYCLDCSSGMWLKANVDLEKIRTASTLFIRLISQWFTSNMWLKALHQFKSTITRCRCMTWLIAAMYIHIKPLYQSKHQKWYAKEQKMFSTEDTDKGPVKEPNWSPRDP